MKLFVHAGYPKCASTLLQKQVLPKQPEINFVSDPKIYDALLLSDYPGGDSARDAVLHAFRNYVMNTNKPVVLSSEHFCMPGSWLETRPGPPPSKRSHSNATGHIARLFDDVTVILVVRNQADWIASWHQERVKRYETRSLQTLLTSTVFMEEIAPRLHYDQVVSEYSALFGNDKIKVIPFEIIREGSESFQQRIFEALGIGGTVIANKQVKGRQSTLVIALRRRTNNLLNLFYDGRQYSMIGGMLFRIFKKLYAFGTLLNFLAPKIDPGKYIPKPVRQSFACDNYHLSDRMDLPLENFGYETYDEDETPGQKRHTL